ncbi:MAG TPA: hypothetical protein VF241_10905 [Propionibacteriaceae bacterium]
MPLRPNREGVLRAQHSAGVHMRAAIAIRFSAPNDLAGHGRHFADTEEQEAEQVRCGIAFGPFEVDVWQSVGVVTYG